MEKIDFKKTLKEQYSTKKTPTIVKIPAMNFAMVDGQGDPNRWPEFQEAVEALFGVSYTIKFMLKKQGFRTDWTVPPLEGLWWTKAGIVFDQNKKDEWFWTVMIMQPNFVTKKIFNQGIEELKARKNPIALAKVRLEKFSEGTAAQVLHIGPYAEEAPTIMMLHEYIAESGYKIAGKHHEIYLGDPRKTDTSKLKTIIRQPVKKK